ncbi:MAG: hypothetical protein KF729_04790 [Sandaracinaceae bacterium]|nr:hypothetical protein [Sandaracinaceae bacterium]
MKIKQMLMALGVVGLLAIGGCGSEEAEAGGSGGGGGGGGTAEPAAGGGGGGGGGGGSCSRIAECCRAYIEAMGGSVPANTCDAYNNISHLTDDVCDQTMAGYRTGLSAMQKAVPAACN